MEGLQEELLCLGVHHAVAHGVALRPERNASVLDEVLPSDRFQGIGVSDDYAAYRDRFPRSQKCWSHLLRKAIALMLAHPAKRHYRRFFERLLELYREAKRYQQDQRLGPGPEHIASWNWKKSSAPSARAGKTNCRRTLRATCALL